MAEPRRVIELVTSARLRRAVEAYRAVIKIEVTARRSKSAFAESIALRDRVLAALTKAGIDPANIEEGGGEIKQSPWSSAKFVVHELRVTQPEMPTLINGMASVEDIFIVIKREWFSGIKRSFSIAVPTAVFVDNPDAVGEALKDAVRRAHARATALAEEAGLQLGAIISIVEEPPPQQPGATRHMIDDGTDSMMMDLDFAEGRAYFADSYTTASPTQSTKSARFRICFEVKENS